MAKLKIVRTPPGFAPEYIRRAWVGIVIRLPSVEELKQDPPTNVGIGNQNSGGYDVLRTDAIEALKAAKKFEVAEYWQGFIIGKFLRFKRDVCEIVE